MRDGTLGLLVVGMVVAVVLAIIGTALLPYIERAAHIFPN